MREPTTTGLELLSSATRERLSAALARHGRLVYSNSLGAEAIVLTDIIWSHPRSDRSASTQRLPGDYALLERLQHPTDGGRAWPSHAREL
jgi:hypothetical protein